MRTQPSLRQSFTRSLSVEPLEGRICLAGHAPECLIDSSGPDASARASHAINCFAVDLYQHFQNEQGNLIVSPTSIATALAMTYAGAAGQTADEMEAVLHLGESPGIHSSFRELIASFDRPEEVSGFVLELANAMWPQIGLRLHDDFVHTIESDYQGSARNLDYSNPEHAKEVINSWVDEQTRGRINDLIDQLSPNTVMVLTNSLYFKALWASPFDPSYTRDRPFYRDDGDSVMVPMMDMGDVFVDGQYPPLPYYTELDGFQVLDLPFEGENTSMVLLLPQQRNGANELSPELMADVQQWIEGPREPVQVDIVLPKFQIAVSSALKPLLIGMGMPSAFGAANFSAMTDLPVWVDKVSHKAFIEVNEQGTEASAATSVELILCFAAGTPVLTPDGEKPIEQLKAGDYVLSRNEGNIEGEVEPKLIEETFHGHTELLELHVGGQVIRVTPPHRFFVMGKGWTPAGEMNVGDQMATDDLSQWMEVEQITPSAEPQPVYNFRVADHHTYFVGGKTWGFAVWTHNDYTGPVFVADHPFHFLIRDNTTSTILFLGRITDPTQAENELIPRVEPVEPIAGDFNHDTSLDCADVDALVSEIASDTPSPQFDLTADDVVDQQDLSRWRALAGATNLPSRAAYLSGDANLDGRVDAADLNVVGRNWRQSTKGWCGGDFTADGVVDPDDLNELAVNWQQDATIATAANPVTMPPRTPRAALARFIAPTIDVGRRTPESLLRGLQQEDINDHLTTSRIAATNLRETARVRQTRFDSFRRERPLPTSEMTPTNEVLDAAWPALIDQMHANGNEIHPGRARFRG